LSTNPERVPELVVEGLTKAYDSSKAVVNVTLSACHGEFISILGPSGCGKTTTLMMIAGLTYPNSGRVFYRGQDITYMPPHLRNLGMVFQNYALFPHLNIFDNVAFPLKMRMVNRGEVRNLVCEALDLVQLSGCEQRKPKDLSGGQQQRVALARALVFGPSLLLMDEPLGALDPALREQMQTEIKRIQQATGVTILYVTHNQNEALAMSDKIVVLDHGTIRTEGPPKEIYEHPCDSFVAEFVGEANLLRGCVLSTTSSGCLVHVTDDLIVTAPNVRSLTLGRNVVVCVRPERIACPVQEEWIENSCSGRIVEVVYLGGVVKYRVALQSSGPGISLVATALTSSTKTLLQEGCEVRIGWKKEDSWVLSDSDDCRGNDVKHPEHPQRNKESAQAI
jgi:putative spermidine/putrescine transport system ATP-binding protein